MMYRQFLVMRKAVPVLLAIGLILSVSMAIANVSLHGSDRFYAPLSFALITLIAWSLATFATIYGAAFAGTSREAARVLWVLPERRWRIAVQAMIVDVAAIVAACLGLIIVIYLPELPVVGVGQVTAMLAQVTWHDALFALAFPFAVYGCSALLGMLLRRAAFAGVATVPAGIAWAIFARDPAAGLLRTLAPLDPVAVFIQSAKVRGLQLHVSGFTADRLAHALQWLTPESGIAILLALGVAACAAAVTVWSRVQIMA